MTTKTSKEVTTIEKQKKITKKVAAAIELLITGDCKTQRAAAKRVDLNECHLSTALKQPHVLAHIERRVRQQLAAGTIKAGSRLMELINAQSEHVSFDASRHVLALSGIKPPSEAPNVNVGVSVAVAGYCIDLTESDGPQERIVSPPPAKTIEPEPPIVDVTPRPGARR